MLKEMTLDGTFRDKVAIAIERIILHMDRGNPATYLAFGGGKDSIVVYDLAKRAGIPLEPHFHFTTVDPPELTKFILDNYPEIIVDRPYAVMKHRGQEPTVIKSMFQLIEFKHTPPTRMLRYCCEVLKEYGGRGRTIITGMRWEESLSRSKREMYERCSKGDDTFYLNPIIDWTTKDVWEYIRKNKIPYCCLYDEGFKRIGVHHVSESVSRAKRVRGKAIPEILQSIPASVRADAVT